MKTYLTNGIILDGTKEMAPVKKTVVIEDGKILRITDSCKPEKEDAVIDLSGSYLLPGLINLHVHIASAGRAPKKNQKPINYKKLFQMFSKNKLVCAVLKKQCADNAKNELLSGVTTIRTVGGILDFDGQIRDEINAGKRTGPRILAANTSVSVPGGHFAGSIATEASSQEEAREHVRRIAVTKPDLIKLMITGGVMDASEEGEPGVLRMPPEVIRAACEEAHRLGYAVAAHVESPNGVLEALRNGVDTIEHGAKLTGEMVQLFHERRAAEICTISPAVPYALFDLSQSHAEPAARKNGKIVMDGIIACTKTCLENGIPVGLGNDAGCPFIMHDSFWRELCYLKKYTDVSTREALYMATLGNAQIAGIDDITGSIAEGKSADLIVVKNNPLEDLTALSYVTMVIIKGNIIRHPKARHNEKVNALLDLYLK